MTTLLKKLTILISAFILVSCSHKAEKNEGQLYIIGGGKRPPEMVKQLVELSGVAEGKWIIVLPMSSSQPDTAAYWAMKQFRDLGVTNVTYFNFKKGEQIDPARIDSLERAGMIYISGGDQSLFMDVVRGTPIEQSIHKAYANGAVVAGTSAGAAVMSKKMITGRQIKQPLMNGFRTIQPGNIEITEGLGLVTSAIIDQHFVWRERMNRLISVAIENPNELAVGIDESTAILVRGDSATVYGASQVVVVDASKASTLAVDSLLGATGMKLNVYIPGQRFLIRAN